MKRLLAAAVVALAALPGAPARASVPVTTSRYHVTVDGEVADGWLSYPTTGTPTTLLVIGHGCCGKPDQSATVAAWAGTYGVVAVAMDYRGPGHWDVMRGHRDLIGATVDLQARFPISRTVIWGLSMGGETTGMAVAARPDLFDFWVDTFGVTDLVQEFATLGLFPGVAANTGNPANPTGSWIVEQTGGTPATAPDAYLSRSPAYHADTMRGLTRAYLVHGIGDFIVPYSESRLMYANLVANGVPVTLETVLTRGGGVQSPWLPAVGGQTVPTPYGPAAHDGAAGGYSAGIVASLLTGGHPDQGIAFREYAVDATTGQSVSTPDGAPAEAPAA